MTTAYEAITKVTGGRDVSISISVGTLCNLMDRQYTPSSWRAILDAVVKQAELAVERQSIPLAEDANTEDSDDEVSHLFEMTKYESPTLHHCVKCLIVELINRQDATQPQLHELDSTLASAAARRWPDDFANLDGVNEVEIAPTAPQSAPESREIPSVLLCPKCGSSEVHHIAGSPDEVSFCCQACGESFSKSRPAGVKSKTPIADAIMEEIRSTHRQMHEVNCNPSDPVDCGMLLAFMTNIAGRIQAVESQS